MILNKQNLQFYKNILIYGTPKWEIYWYIIYRLFNFPAKFDEEVFIKDGDMILNCGYVMENCKVACSNFECGVKKAIDEFPIGTFIDIGSHIGKHSVYASKRGFKVFAIEADKENSRLLKYNLKNNHLENVWFVFNEILSDKKGKVNYYRYDLHPARNSIIESEGRRLIEAESDTLDNVLEFHKMKGKILMKIDVEGAELKVLQGAKKFLEKYHPTIIFEAWSNNDVIQVGNYLHQFGYGIQDIRQLDNEYNWMAMRK